MVTEYKVAEGHGIVELEKVVKALLSIGWTLHGSMIVGNFRYYQVMVWVEV